MHVISAGELRSVLHYRMLIERLRQGFRAGCALPPAQRYVLPGCTDQDTRLTLRPAWVAGRHIGVMVEATVPDNSRRDLPVTTGCYLLLDGKTGTALAVLDAKALITQRTAAAAALAASYLARPDASRLLVLGTGTLAAHLIEAYAVALPIRQVLIWGRDPAKAERIAGRFRRGAVRVSATTDLEGAVRGAEIIASATAATRPVLRGDWLEPGVHIDLIGSTSPEAREADDEVIRRGRIFVDSRERALLEAGDLVQPLAAGLLAPGDIAGDLFDLARGERSGRRFYDQITVCKAVGCALEDLIAAELAVEMAIHNETLR
ncbi:MAG: ornithine cyclodeaminase family protein [Rhodospirillaceae bacterium]